MRKTAEKARERVDMVLEQAGLPLHGFCPFCALTDRLLPCRAAARLPEESRTVIVSLFPYRFPEEGRRNLSRYACVPDYHKAAGQVLKDAAAVLSSAFPARRFEPFIDNSPIPEVYAAATAGLGRIGDNGLLFHPVFGSWVFIGCIVTELDLRTEVREPPGCIHCGACSRRCPAGCILQADKPVRCLSATSQKKGEWSAAEAELFRESPLIWGCDICQECCPLNRGTAAAPHPCFTSYDGWLDREKLDAMDKADLGEKAYGWRGRAVLERNLAAWTSK